MKITKDPQLILCKVVDKTSKKIVSFDVGFSSEEVDGNVAYNAMINNIEKGQQYQIQAEDSADPANVVVKDTEDGKVLVTGSDDNELNNISYLKARYIGNEPKPEVTEEAPKAEEPEPAPDTD